MTWYHSCSSSPDSLGCEDASLFELVITVQRWNEPDLETYPDGYGLLCARFGDDIMVGPSVHDAPWFGLRILRRSACIRNVVGGYGAIALPV
jgi:hypothetical protein